MHIVYKGLNDKAIHTPTYMTKRSAGCDVRADEDILIKPKACGVKVKTGLFLERQEEYEGPLYELQLRARSGLAARTGLRLSNGVGTIDEDYGNEICVLFDNISDDPVKIYAGDRIAQLVVSMPLWLDGANIAGLVREGGFGSTDVKSEGGN